jgi:hypothetical protein
MHHLLGAGLKVPSLETLKEVGEMNRVNSVAITACISCIVVLAAADWAAAKWIDRTPQTDSPDYWDTHIAAVVQVTSVKPRDPTSPHVGFNYGQPDSVLVKPVTLITPSAWEAEVELSRHNTWFTPRGDFPVLSVGQHVLLWRSSQAGPDYMAASLIEAAEPEQSALVKACKAIAGMRKMPLALNAFRESVSSDQPLAVRYAINRIVKEAVAGDKVVPELDRLRQDEEVDVQVRIVASEAINRLLKRDSGTSDDWKWLTTAIERSRKLDEVGLNPLIQRLVNYGSKRSETVAFFIRMATTPANRSAIRTASIEVMKNQGIYDYVHPSDPSSEKVFTCLLNLLRDKNPDIRARAADTLLKDVDSVSWGQGGDAPPSSHGAVNPAVSQAEPKRFATSLAMRAAASVGAALEKETDEGTRPKLKSVLDRLQALMPAEKKGAADGGK